MSDSGSALREQILRQALALTPEDRAFVVEALEESLTPSDFATPEIAAAWAEEIERRAEACERGEMPADDWRTVMARLRNQAATTTPVAP